MSNETKRSTDYEAAYHQFKPFLAKLCYRFRNVCEQMEHDDLMQIAFFGLCKAVDTYSEESGATFMHYLAMCVKWVIIREVEKCGYAIRISHDMNCKIRGYCRAVKELGIKLSRTPLPQEISARMNISISEVVEVERALRMQSIKSLDDPVGDDGESSFGDFIPADDDGALDALERNEMRSMMWGEVNKCLDAKLAELVTNHIRNCIPLSHIAEQEGIARHSIYNKYQRALRILRKIGQIQQLAKDCGYATGNNYRHVTLAEWKHTFTSAVEAEILLLEQRKERQEEKKRENILSRIEREYNEQCEKQYAEKKRQEYSQQVELSSFSQYV